MATKPIPLRFPPDLLARIDAFAAERELTRSEAVFSLLAMALDDDVPRLLQPKAAPRPAQAPKVEAAKEALRTAEEKTGLRKVMEGVPFGQTRGPYQKGAAKVEKAKR